MESFLLYNRYSVHAYDSVVHTLFNIDDVKSLYRLLRENDIGIYYYSENVYLT